MIELDDILQEVEKIHLDRMKVLEAYVKTVIPLTAEERNALTEKLQKKYARTIVLKEEIDKDIIGGVFIRVGNHIMDGTIKSKFENIRKLTLKTE